MINMKNITRIVLVTAAMTLAACGSKKHVVDDGKGTALPTITTQGTDNTGSGDNSAVLRQMISDVPQTDNIVSSIDFNLKTGGKDITVDGKISMRKNEVVRIQLSPMGLVEVGRLEFTKDSVLIMDRMHKQFLKSSYEQVSFLKNNGIDFYALQALFWNQLFMPGKPQVSESALGEYKVSGQEVTLNQGKMNYKWNVLNNPKHVKSTTATYNSSKHGTSQLHWAYDDFKAFSGTMFPARQTFTISTVAAGKQKNITVDITMKNLKTNSDWEGVTKVPSKYKPVALEDVINKIMKLQ